MAILLTRHLNKKFLLLDKAVILSSPALCTLQISEEILTFFTTIKVRMGRVG